MDTTITREEAIRRLKATKEAKKRRIEILRARMSEKCIASGEDPNNIVFL